MKCNCYIKIENNYVRMRSDKLTASTPLSILEPSSNPFMQAVDALIYMRAVADLDPETHNRLITFLRFLNQAP